MATERGIDQALYLRLYLLMFITELPLISAAQDQYQRRNKEIFRERKKVPIVWGFFT